MQGYSKIKTSGSRKSKQLPDFSDLSSPNHASKTIPKPSSKFQIANESKPANEGANGERFDVVLNRTCSVSSSSRRYKLENTGKSDLQSAMKRAFSMSRSSSVSERYSRIHMTTSSYDPDEVNNKNGDFVMKKKGAKIFKACKSLFRF